MGLPKAPPPTFAEQVRVSMDGADGDEDEVPEELGIGAAGLEVAVVVGKFGTLENVMPDPPLA